MADSVTDLTLNAFTDQIANQGHAMAGAVIAANAAQAVALGVGCVRITRRNLALSAKSFAAEIARLDQIRSELLTLCDQDAQAIARFVALREAGKTLEGQQLLCRLPAMVCGLAVEAAELLQAFRPEVHERVRDDLEMSIALLAGTARAALLLLDSNLRIWPLEPLQEEFGPRQTMLANKIENLLPLKRISA